MSELDDLHQMVGAPLNGFSQGEWCEAANDAVLIALDYRKALDHAEAQLDVALHGGGISRLTQMHHVEVAHGIIRAALGLVPR